jgi:cellulose synthase/poly-beta-1,6-N-acetylglucosamine synthase-like glycosyltransferase
MSQPKISITREKNKDFGFVILLGLLLFYFNSGNILFLQLSVLCILVSLVIPVVLKPFSFIWYQLSEAMGTIVSRIILFAIFFFIITPIGVGHRVISKKRLLTEQWKKSRGSVFKDRNVCFTFSDIKNPF